MTFVPAHARTTSLAAGLSSAVTLGALVLMFTLHHEVAQNPVSVALIWIAMTVGMMAPSAIPMIATFSKMSEQLDPSRGTLALSSIFLLAYLVLWSGYGLLAAALQVQMRHWFLIDQYMTFTNPLISAELLLAAGVFQLSSLKHVCLTKCRSPLGFLSSSYRSGYRNAFRIGLLHAAFCIGCCWLLMALAWFGGVMNMAWMAVLSTIIILEKTLPTTAALEKVTGVLLCGLALIIALSRGQEGVFLFKALASICHTRT